MSAALQMQADDTLVRVRDLSVRFVSRDATVHAVNGVDLDLAAGEVLCILCESGSGKSVRAVTGPSFASRCAEAAPACLAAVPAARSPVPGRTARCERGVRLKASPTGL